MPLSAVERRFPSMGRTVWAVAVHPRLFFRGIRCILVILDRFFLFQFRAALFHRIPVSQVDHILDKHIPFNPGFIGIYLDFVAFWIRIVGFLSIGHGKRGRELAAEFIDSITKLYFFASEIYRKNLSTTDRPCYKKNLRFRMIHLLDPHLMCVPSLHVMIVIHTWTAFRHYLKVLGEDYHPGDGRPLDGRPLEKKVFRGAVSITEAILYIKQHSINCVAAALYTMEKYNPALFSQADAEHFVYSLFAAKTDNAGADIAGNLVLPEDIPWLREHIIVLYRVFNEQSGKDWTAPILEFLKARLPKKSDRLEL